MPKYGNSASIHHHVWPQGIAVREERISGLAYRDNLTSLANRTVFRKRSMIICKRKSFSILLMDIDRLKTSAIFGHQIGDPLLKQIVGRLLETTSMAIWVYWRDLVAMNLAYWSTVMNRRHYN